MTLRRPEGPASIDEIVREGARRMLAEALQAEVDAYVAQFTDQRDYAEARAQLCSRPRGPSFFVSTRGTRLIYHCVHTTFAQLLTRAGITAPAGASAPTIHGLRHSFAVATLRDWYRAGVDVAARLPALSAYMGHAHPASTYWYLTAAPDLLALAAQRLERAAGEPR